MKRRVSVEIDLDALKRNYAKIAERVEPAGVLSVLKANAYGLGVAEYAKALFDAGCPLSASPSLMKRWSLSEF